MIRRIYLDFLLDRLKRGELKWLLSRGKEYLLIRVSALVGRPLCGPVLGTVVTNYRCNYRCVMCDLPLREAELRERGLAELDTDAMKGLLREFKDLGVSGIGFTGGEPLLRGDIIDLLAYTKQLGMISHLNTNGSLLDEKMIMKIIDAKVDSINISLDGARPETHDRIRGVPGAYAKAVAAIEKTCALRDRTGAPLRVKTVAVLQEENIDEVAALISLARDLTADCIEFVPRQGFRTDGSGAGPADPAFLSKVQAVTEQLQAHVNSGIVIENSRSHLKLIPGAFRNEPSPLRCFAGYNSLAVDSYGEIYPCVPWYNWRRSVGNVKNISLTGFWYSREYARIRKELATCRSCTLNCQAELNILFNPLRW